MLELGILVDGMFGHVSVLPSEGGAVFSKIKSASSFPAKLGRGICSTASQPGISRVIHSAIVSLAKAVKPEAF